MSSAVVVGIIIQCVYMQQKRTDCSVLAFPHWPSGWLIFSTCRSNQTCLHKNEEGMTEDTLALLAPLCSITASSAGAAEQCVPWKSLGKVVWTRSARAAPWGVRSGVEWIVLGRVVVFPRLTMGLFRSLFWLWETCTWLWLLGLV